MILPRPLMKLLSFLYINRFERLLPYVNLSFSQEGEDLILRRLFENKNNGFYVDVGAHHPIRFSNTYLFYRLGWRGINIDACPGSMNCFNHLRPHDINIEAAIGRNRERLEYFIFDEPALNSFDRSLSMQRQQETSYRITETRIVEMAPLSQILEKRLPTGQNIDFLNIDVEGLEIEVLKSNDWNRFKPKVILIEYLSRELNQLIASEIHKFVSSLNYKLISSTPNTLIYQLDPS